MTETRTDWRVGAAVRLARSDGQSPAPSRRRDAPCDRPANVAHGRHAAADRRSRIFEPLAVLGGDRQITPFMLCTYKCESRQMGQYGVGIPTAGHQSGKLSEPDRPVLFPYGITTIKLVPEEAQTAAEMIRRVLLAAEPVATMHLTPCPGARWKYDVTFHLSRSKRAGESQKIPPTGLTSGIPAAAADY